MSAIQSALAGMARAESRLDTAAKQIARLAYNASNPAAVDTVNLSAQAVALLEARDNFAANAKMLKTAGELDKALLGIAG